MTSPKTAACAWSISISRRKCPSLAKARLWFWIAAVDVDRDSIEQAAQMPDPVGALSLSSSMASEF